MSNPYQYNTFEYELFETIPMLAGSYGETIHSALSKTLQVCSGLLASVDAIAKMRADLKEEVRQELLRELQKPTR